MVSAGGDGTPFPVASILKDATGKPVISKELGLGTYKVSQVGGTVLIIATGGTQLNVVVALEQSSLTVFPPQFALFFFVPEVVQDAPKEFVVTATFNTDESIDEISIFDAEGRHEVKVTKDLMAFGWDHGNASRAKWTNRL